MKINRGSAFFNNISIKWQLMAICILLVVIPVVTLGILSYESARKEILSQVETKLEEEALDTKETVIAHIEQVQFYNEMQRDATKQTISAMALDAYYMMELADKANGGVTSKESRERVYDSISKIKVGETGYIYVLDTAGRYVVSQNRLRDGENIWNAQDANGRFFIQDMVNQGKKLDKGDVYIIEYPWKNKDDPAARTKMAAITYYEPWDAIIGVGAYFSDFSDEGFTERIKEEVKAILAEDVVGKTGYVFVVDSKGNYVVSQNRLRDGENIWDARDAEGNNYIQEIITGSKALGEHETYFQLYPWKDSGDLRARDKVAVTVYIPEWDWVMGPAAYYEEFLDGLAAVQQQIFLVCVVAVIAGTIVAYLFASTISGPIKSLAEKSERMAHGDLTIAIDDVEGTNEIASLNSAFKTMVVNLRMLITNIKGNSMSTASSAEELSASSEEVNASMQQVSTTIQEIAKSAQTVTKGASVAQEASKKTREKSLEGTRVAKAVGERMENVNTSTTQGADRIKALGQKSEKIGKIVETIKNISEQTNLLALNAAIEAARAGEAGRGFAVVADEVRKLAEESGKASEVIANLVAEIQTEIRQSVDAMGDNTKQVMEASASVLEAQKSFEEIPILVENVVRALDEMSAVAEENAAGSEEVSSSTQQVTGAMQQVSESAQRLSLTSDELRVLVDKFKVDAGNMNLSILDQAISDHKAWVQKLKGMVGGALKLTDHELKDYQECRLGKWYYAAGKEQFGTNPVFLSLEEPHKKVHLLGNEAVKLWNAGRKDDAKKRITEVDEASRHMLTILEELKRTGV